MIDQDNAVKIDFVAYDKVKDLIGYEPTYLKNRDKSVRIVTYTSDEKCFVSCPCSGTHVRKNNEITKLKIRKLKKKGQTIRISYET